MANPILVIDDDPATARIVEEQLGLTSLGVLAVTSLVEGVEIARRRPPCMVFLNIDMTDAPDVASHLKEHLATFVLVLLRRDDSAVNPSEHPADAWMNKPLDLKEVRRLVGSISEEVAALPPPLPADAVRRRDPRRRPQPPTRPPGVSNDRRHSSPSVKKSPPPRARDDPGPAKPAPDVANKDGDAMTQQTQRDLEAAKEESQQLAQKVQGLQARLNVARTKHYEQVATIQVLESRAKHLEDEARETATALRNAQIEQSSLQEELEALRQKLENAPDAKSVAVAMETSADVALLRAELKVANDELAKVRGAAEAQWAEAKARVLEAQSRSQRAAEAAAQAAQAAELVGDHVKAMDKRLKAAVERAEASEQREAELRKSAGSADELAAELAAAQETIVQLRSALESGAANDGGQDSAGSTAEAPRGVDRAHKRSALESKEDKSTESGPVAATGVAGDKPADDQQVATSDQDEQEASASQLAAVIRERDDLAAIIDKLKADLALPQQDEDSQGSAQQTVASAERDNGPADQQWRTGYFIAQAENAVLRQNIERLEGAGAASGPAIGLLLKDFVRILKAQREDFEKEVERWRRSRSIVGQQIQKLLELAQTVPELQQGDHSLKALLGPLQEAIDVASEALDTAQGLLEEQHESMLQRLQA